MADFVERQFHTGDVSVNVAEWPGNGPPLMFIHGVTSDWSTWEKIIPAFTGDWHCYAIDLRGHGKSSHIPGGYHRDLYAVDPVCLITQEIQEPTYVIGHSLGATTAVGVASSIPGLVKAVVYEDPPMFTHQVAKSGRSRFGWQLEMMEADLSVDDMADVIFQQNGGDRTAAELKAKQLKQMDADVLRSTVSGEASENWDVESQLRKATSPALLLTANPELGGVMTEDWTRRSIDLLPDATAEQWNDSGHGMHTTFPDRFVDVVGAFITTVRDA